MPCISHKYRARSASSVVADAYNPPSLRLPNAIHAKYHVGPRSHPVLFAHPKRASAQRMQAGTKAWKIPQASHCILYYMLAVVLNAAAAAGFGVHVGTLVLLLVWVLVFVPVSCCCCCCYCDCCYCCHYSLWRLLCGGSGGVLVRLILFVCHLFLGGIPPPPKQSMGGRCMCGVVLRFWTLQRYTHHSHQVSLEVTF